MQNCERCGLALPPGAAHINEGSCITALRAALAASKTCQSCGQSGKKMACVGCAATAKGKELLAKGALGIAQYLLNEDEGGESGGKKFNPS